MRTHHKPDLTPAEAAIAIALMLGVFVAACLGIGYAINHRQVPTPIVSTTARPTPDSWRFQPHPDMTPAEAAIAIALMLGGPDFTPAVGEKIEAMPPELRRHWLAPEPLKQQ